MPGFNATPGGKRWIFLTPPAGQPYLAVGFRVEPPTADAGATGPVRLDHSARRGVVVHGQVTDQRTGAPIPGSVVAGAILVPGVRPGGMKLIPENSHLQDYPGHIHGHPAPAPTDADGRYQVVLPPGLGLVAFRAETPGNYLCGQGQDAIPGIVPPFANVGSASFLTVGKSIHPAEFPILAGVDPPAGTRDLTLDLVVTGRTMDRGPGLRAEVQAIPATELR